MICKTLSLLSNLNCRPNFDYFLEYVKCFNAKAVANTMHIYTSLLVTCLGDRYMTCRYW